MPPNTTPVNITGVPSTPSDNPATDDTVTALLAIEVPVDVLVAGPATKLNVCGTNG